MDNPLAPIKVSVEHKKEITQTIPDDVTRARNSAWLDIISPLTEWAGLHGDELKHKRDLMRLEREASLFELSQRLRAKIEGETISPVPTKQLIPILEKASLEARNSDLIDKWANLLASAARSPGDDVAICTSILAEIGSTEAAMLEKSKAHLVRLGQWSPDKVKMRHASWRSFASTEYLALQELLADFNEQKTTWDTVRQKFVEVNDRSPNEITHFTFQSNSGEGKSASVQFSEGEHVAIDVLKYRNLLQAETYWEMIDLKKPRAPHRGTLSIGFVYLTDLAILFLNRVSSPESSNPVV